MRQRMRIQARPRSYEPEDVPARLPPAPVPAAFKLLSVAGFVLFWLYYFGLVGSGSRDDVDSGFALFVAMQIPLLWMWLRGQTASR